MSFSAFTEALVSLKHARFSCIHLFLPTSFKVLTGYTYYIAFRFGVSRAQTQMQLERPDSSLNPTVQLHLTEAGRLIRVEQRRCFKRAVLLSGRVRREGSPIRGNALTCIPSSRIESSHPFAQSMNATYTSYDVARVPQRHSECLHVILC